MAGTLELWMYPRDRGTCRGPNCRAPIFWRETTNGKKVPLDDNPEPIERRQSSTGRLIEIVSSEPMHHRTCPDVESFRRERERAAAAQEERAPCLPLE
jgi:hypothetical protein